MMNDRILEIALILGQARLDKTPVLLADDLMPTSEDEAYSVQAALHAWLEEQGQGGLSGYKIGCTTAVMQEVVGVPGPTFGGVLAANTHHGAARFPMDDFQGVGIECEVAFKLRADLPPTGAPYERPAIEDAIGSCMAAIEIVDNRYGDFLKLPAPVLIADDFFQSAAVLGTEVGDWQGLDLAGCEGRTYIDGRLAGSGPGSDVLGHPLNAALWIVNRMAQLGRGLKAGQVIMTGSLAPVQWIEHAPAEAMISIDGLGEVRASFD